MVFDFSQSYEAVSREAPHSHVKRWNPINFVRWLLPPLPSVELVFNLPTFLAPVDVSTKVSPNSLFWRRYCLCFTSMNKLRTYSTMASSLYLQMFPFWQTLAKNKTPLRKPPLKSTKSKTGTRNWNLISMLTRVKFVHSPPGTKIANDIFPSPSGESKLELTKPLGNLVLLSTEASHSTHI